VSHGTSHRFLIVRLGSLGDVIHAIPVAAALRERYPFARIDWMVDPRYLAVLDLVQGLDVRIPVDPRRSPRALLSTIGALRRVRYTAAIDLQGLVKSAVLARAAGAWHTIGFPREQLREPLARSFYSDAPDPGPHAHVVFRNLALLRPLGARDLRPAFPIATPVTPAVEDVSHRFGTAGYALINPGAAWPNKRWPASRFGEVAAALARTRGLRSIVLWGPGEEPLARAVAEASGGAAETAPPTDVVDLFGIARGARLMISGDTGPLHIAAAMETPIVALFGPTRADRNGPWSPADISVSVTDRCSCLYRRKCRRRAACIDEIGVEEVVAAANRRLSSP
jgi:lipopolysaccharide heptosyltransferase I